jgi:tetratricopeptide (TPR) repeat protein
LIGKAWGALGKPDYEMVLACTQAIIANWTTDADRMQAQRIADNTCASAVPTNTKNTQAVNDFNANYWALNDVAVAWYLSGEALTKLGKTTEAKEAYRTVTEKYSCGYAWDPHGWFWNVSDVAKKK